MMSSRVSPGNYSEPIPLNQYAAIGTQSQSNGFPLVK